MKFWALRINSESGDHYPIVLLSQKPTQANLKKILLSKFPEEFDEKNGPGMFGTYLHVQVEGPLEVEKI